MSSTTCGDDIFEYFSAGPILFSESYALPWPHLRIIHVCLCWYAPVSGDLGDIILRGAVECDDRIRHFFQFHDLLMSLDLEQVLDAFHFDKNGKQGRASG